MNGRRIAASIILGLPALAAIWGSATAWPPSPPRTG
jgi:hypothetical protein